MRAFLLSAILYLCGVAVILFLKPPAMFHRDGRWKEFGTGPGQSVFPFWAFCVAWAMVSYLLSLAILRAAASPEAAAAAAATAAAVTRSRAALQEIPDYDEEEEMEDMVMPLPTRPARGKNIARLGQGNMKPGYYMLNKAALRKTGIPKYIYLGPEPEPEDAEESVTDVPTTTSGV